jgi:serine/threonine protein kinase
LCRSKCYEAKLFARGKMTEEDRIGLLNEIDILKQVDHPNIVKLIDVYEDSQTFSLVLELMTGGEVSGVVFLLVCSCLKQFLRRQVSRSRKLRSS